MVEPREIDHTRPLNRTSSTDSHPMIERLEKKKKKERKEKTVDDRNESELGSRDKSTT